VDFVRLELLHILLQQQIRLLRAVNSPRQPPIQHYGCEGLVGAQPPSQVSVVDHLEQGIAVAELGEGEAVIRATRLGTCWGTYQLKIGGIGSRGLLREFQGYYQPFPA
jgi:hypothetical protein